MLTVGKSGKSPPGKKQKTENKKRKPMAKSRKKGKEGAMKKATTEQGKKGKARMIEAATMNKANGMTGFTSKNPTSRKQDWVFLLDATDLGSKYEVDCISGSRFRRQYLRAWLLQHTAYTMNIRDSAGFASIHYIAILDDDGGRPMYMEMHCINDDIHKMEGEMAEK
jgi:hypothetical protein